MTYRILSLDGGGAWALIEVRALMALYDENKTGHDILKDFDMVAANSGGSLVLGGLVENLPLKDLLSYFQSEQKRKAIFSPTGSFGDRVLRDVTGMGPKYSTIAKLPALQRLLPGTGDTPLERVVSGIQRTGSGTDVHLLVIGFDYDRNRAKFFRSAQTGTGAGNQQGDPRWGQGDTSDVTLADAIHASTNAPVNYFDGPAQFPTRSGRYWDGGLTGCNNPVLAAVTEAIALGQEPANIVALSLGTATVALPWPTGGQCLPSPFLQSPSDTGLVSDLKKLATAILDDPPDIATYLAHVMTGSGAGVRAPAQSRIVRMNPLISPIKNGAGNWTAPGSMTAAQFSYLTTLDMDAVEQGQVDTISSFADLWVQDKAPNQPIRMDSDTLAIEIGDPWFSRANASWNAIK
jgi:hypothetical protein